MKFREGQVYALIDSIVEFSFVCFEKAISLAIRDVIVSTKSQYHLPSNCCVVNCPHWQPRPDSRRQDR